MPGSESSIGSAFAEPRIEPEQYYLAGSYNKFRRL